MNEVNGIDGAEDANGYGQSTAAVSAMAATDTNSKMQPITFNKNKIALPLHLQRLVSSLDMTSFMSFAHTTLSQPLTSSESEGSDIDWDELHAGDRFYNGIKSSKQERLNDKMYVYNFTQVGPDRKWLQDLLLSDTETDSDISDEDVYIKKMLKDRIKEKKRREKYYKKTNNSQYGYFGAGMLSVMDQFPDHQRSIVGIRKRRKRHEKKEKTKISKIKNSIVGKPFKEPGEIDPADIDNIESGESGIRYKNDHGSSSRKSHNDSGTTSGRGRKKKLGITKLKPENMKIKRKKVWQIMAKKELGKIQRAKANNHKEILQGCKRMASMCMKVSRQKAMQSQKIMKETVWRAKRLTREMLGYWKRYDRVERETRRRMEKEAEEQRKIDVELIEVKRQQRKLNFLITQTELYAHFMSKKLGKGTEEEQLRILSQLDEEINPRLACYDDYNSDLMKQKAQKNAEIAFNADTNRTHQFDVMGELDGSSTPKFGTDGIRELPQPDLFQGTLKTYQLKGMTWLANLYDQGISGILADEMGLGKTVQSIAFLCHIAERYGVWGPFLIISPASTLHNWQQEMQRFVPAFNVVPYWGSPNERKILRQFWEQKDLHTKDASFHVVITSYQLVVSDYKYFNRIKWQYMILDEAQAIKSSSSMRWKLLLGFNCRNRLLLSGTPIQNSMAELWALLHFIMPTLFDSHDEFNEWFSKDIESHAENKTGIDEKQISRLHMILKPFMLRRIKKDVENELSDKIEIMVYCPLTTRQKLLYIALKKKIRIEDLLHYTVGGGDGHVDRNFTSNLMNLVMQFRKVCNHPELFERRDAKSSFAMKCQEYTIPRLIHDYGILNNCLPSKKHLLYNRFSIFKAENIHRSLFPLDKNDSKVNYTHYIDLNMDSAFSFSRFIDLTPNEIEDVTIGGLLKFLQSYLRLRKYRKMMNLKKSWSFCFPHRQLLLQPTFENPLNRCYIEKYSVFRAFIFTSMVSTKSSVYTFGNYQTVNMQETIEHRVIRSKIHSDPDVKQFQIEPLIKEENDNDVISELQLEDVKPIISPTRGRPPKNQDKGLQKTPTILLPEFPHYQRPPKIFECEPLDMPRFLYDIGQKVQATKRRQYCDHRGAEWSHINHLQCNNEEGRQIVYGGLDKCKLQSGWSSIIIPDKQTLVSDAGKLAVLDSLLKRLKAQGHRVLIYSQMTKMIDLLEEYMWHRKHRYMRLDGSSKISARRDMVADFQTRADIFVFLLSTRAGGLGINLTAADTVIFYDSDWNPTVDQQAMDRAHRLGQTKQVTVYRLICKGTIEERILQRAREKSEIQRMVISGGNFKPDTLKPKEVVSLLLDDEEIELKFRQKTDDPYLYKDNDKKRKIFTKNCLETTTKHIKRENDTSIDGGSSGFDNGSNGDESTTKSEAILTSHEPLVPGAKTVLANDDSSNETLIVDCDDGPNRSISPSTFTHYGVMQRRRHHPRGTKRGRPRGSRRGGGNGISGRSDISSQSCGNLITPVNSIIGESQVNTENGSFTAVVPQVKRGPGRPRLKPGGPPNQGSRGSTRTRKPIGPLVVPLGQSPAATPLNRSPAMSPAHERNETYS